MLGKTSVRKAHESGRDDRQRSLGYFGFSMMAHVILLMALTLVAGAPKRKEIAGLVQGITSGGSDAVIMDLAPSSPTSPGSKAIEGAPAQQLLADKNDADAVELSKEKPAPPVAVHAVKNPAPKVKSAPAVAREDGDVAVLAALKKAREEENEKAQVAEQEENEKPQQQEIVKPVVVAQMDEDQPAPEAASSDDAETAPPVVAAVAAPTKTAAVAAPTKTAAVAAPVAKQNAPAQVAPSVPAPSRAAAPVLVSSTTTQAQGSGTGGNGSAAAAGRGTLGYGAPAGVLINADLLKERNGPRPPYPDQDRLMNRTGLVIVRATVLSDGSVSNVRLAQSSGSGQMDASAVNTYYRWKYFPGQAGEVMKKFYFRLDGASETRYAKLRHK